MTGEKNVIALVAHQTKLKTVGKGAEPRRGCFNYICRKLPVLLKLKMVIFDGPQISEQMKNQHLQDSVDSTKVRIYQPPNIWWLPLFKSLM